ncbi:hypothetical protein ACWDGI_40490 [Streptomyces sp. NPDC001220]
MTGGGLGRVVVGDGEDRGGAGGRGEVADGLGTGVCEGGGVIGGGVGRGGVTDGRGVGVRGGAGFVVGVRTGGGGAGGVWWGAGRVAVGTGRTVRVGLGAGVWAGGGVARAGELGVAEAGELGVAEACELGFTEAGELGVDGRGEGDRERLGVDGDTGTDGNAVTEGDGVEWGLLPPWWDDTRAQAPRPAPRATTAAPPAIHGVRRDGCRCRFMVLTVYPIADGLKPEPEPQLTPGSVRGCRAPGLARHTPDDPDPLE